MKLELDLGNSFLKWRLTDSSGVLTRGRQPISEIDLFVEQIGANRPSLIFVSSVAGDKVDRQLADLCWRCWSVIPVFAQIAKSDSVPLISAYLVPNQMGIDRWMAMLAARASQSGPLLVVDAGSAITIDELDSGYNHLGGYILPGFKMLQRSLLGDTARVRFEQTDSGNIAGGRSTAECVASGAELILRGVALQLQERAVGHSGSRILLTGGDADRLKPYLAEIDFLENKELVLDGLTYAKMEPL